MSRNKKVSNAQINVDASYFNEKYVPYLNSKARYNVFYGGSSSGKSYFVASALVLDLLQHKKKLLVVRQTFATIRESVFAEIQDALANMNLLSHVKTSQSTLKMEFPNGSEIIFRGADDSSKLLSIKGIDTVWVEEASEISQDMFHTLETRLRGIGHKKQFYLTFNPISASHWLKREFFDNPKDDQVVCHSTYLDNRFLDDDTIKNLLDMKERNPVFYDVYALGKWGVIGKRVYENWTVKDFNIADLVKENDNLHTAIGLDYGFINDPSTLVCSLVDLENRKLYIFDELYQKGLLNDEFAQRIIEMGYARQVIVADSAEQKSIEEMRQYGITRIKSAKKGAGSVMQGIQFIQQFQVFIHPSCKHTIEEFEHYSYRKDKQTGQYLNQPVDNFNHCITGDTLINTTKGDIPISKLVGTEGSVFCFDENKQQSTISNYFDVRMTREQADIYELELSNGKRVKATADHLILTLEGWKELGELTEDDEVLDIGGFINEY